MHSRQIRPTIILSAVLSVALSSACDGDDAMPVEDAGDATEDAGDDQAHDDGEEHGPAAIEGQVGRSESAEIWPGNDGIGTLYVAVFADACGGDQVVGGAAVPDADLSDPSYQVPYSTAELPPGTYFVGGFLDDDGNADPSAPAPSQGDIVLAAGAGPGCIEVVIAGEDMREADFTLNITLPF
jgi:hypothetical protein